MCTFEQWGCLERSKKMYEFGNMDIRRWYQRDIDQIVHSTAFRKLQKKSQLLSEHDPRSRSRLIHTIEVSRIALEISEKLGLSKELTEAISMGHDIATSPYGFVGNEFLKKHVKSKKKSSNPSEPYTHEIAGSYMIETIAQKKLTDQHMINSAAQAFSFESDLGWREIKVDQFPYKIRVSRAKSDGEKYIYYGYFITPEVVDGILNHGGHGKPNTLEGQVVQFSDNIAYLSQDIDDLMYSGIIAAPEEYTKYEAGNSLPNNGGDKTWDEIDKWFLLGRDAKPSLKEVFNRSRGIRIATLVSRYVNYNMELLKQGKLEFMHSSILEKEIPILKIDDGLKFVLDFLWTFIERFYDRALIKTSNDLQKAKLQQVWEIIQDEDFIRKNNSYLAFSRSLEDSRFDNQSESWKTGYFISHLCWSDIDTIISSFHRRDYSFEIDFEEGGNENN